MKIEKNNNKVVCDFLGCGNLADFEFNLYGKKYFICRNCAITLNSELNKILKKEGA